MTPHRLCILVEFIKRVEVKKDKYDACGAFHLFFTTSLINLNNTRAHMLDYINHMTDSFEISFLP